jgi:hypothetical protein
MLLAYAGDALWVVALSIMFGASRQAARRIPPGVRPPVAGVRLPRALALWALPGAAFLLSLWFALEARQRGEAGDAALIVFGVRAVAASTLALIHLRWLAAGLAALERESSPPPTERRGRG